MRRAQKIRAEARVLYHVAKRSYYVDDGLLHVLHALELEDEAARLDARDEARERSFAQP